MGEEPVEVRVSDVLQRSQTPEFGTGPVAQSVHDNDEYLLLRRHDCTDTGCSPPFYYVSVGKADPVAGRGCGVSKREAAGRSPGQPSHIGTTSLRAASTLSAMSFLITPVQGQLSSM